MSDTAFETPTNAPEFSVSEISGALKKTVEETFGHVRVRGEISGFRGRHASGHCYFSLKDDKSRIEAVVWRATFAGLAFKPEEGLEVIATGRLTTFPGSSKYQIVVEELKPAGAGALMALLNERRLMLEAEGLFAAGVKRPLPFMPMRIGIVTSPTGAVIRDICHRIGARFPVRLLVWPVRVQGETSGREVAAAIAGFDALPEGGKVPRPDLVIVARGGGSLEDLWGFNDEAVVRAAAACTIPLISAVGHETDWTLLDHVADARAPTPTAAAEMAVPVLAEIRANLAGIDARQHVALERTIAEDRRAILSLGRALPAPDALIALPRRRLEESGGALSRAERHFARERRHRLATAAGGINILSLEGLLKERRTELRSQETRITHTLGRLVAKRRQMFGRLAALLRPQIVLARHAEEKRRLDRGVLRLDAILERRIREDRGSTAAAWRLVEGLAPQRVLERGYAIIRDEADRPVTSSDAIPAGSMFTVEFAGDDRRSAIATGTGAGARKRPGRGAREAGGTNQGDLF